MDAEARRSSAEPAIVILGTGSLYAARRIQVNFPHARIHGLRGRVEDADVLYDEFGPHLRALYEANMPIVVVCAAGIVVRALAPCLSNKRAEPPVVVVAEDGSAVVPLLGGLNGVNAMAHAIAEVFEVNAAITTTGEVRFGATFERPPDGYVVRNPEAGKAFMSDLLAGAKMRIDGDAPWLIGARLPLDPAADHVLRVTVDDADPPPDTLVYHPRAICIGIDAVTAETVAHVRAAVADRGWTMQAVAGIFAPDALSSDVRLCAAGRALALPVRFLAAADAKSAARAAAGSSVTAVSLGDGLSAAIAPGPVDARAIGRGHGRLIVIGLGPGDPAWLSPEARAELARATDLVGYETYLKMADPYCTGQQRHSFDNREEEKRSRFALDLAAEGKSVAVVSSGDPGIFAMATAILETLHRAGEPRWQTIDLKIVPGISAAQGAAARIGAPLGHDFCVISLSDVLKPWEVVADRLDHAAAADLAIALYNPTSKFRPWQLERARDILLKHRRAETPVVLAKNVGRAGEEVRVTTLGTLDLGWVDMRTVLLIGSSKTEIFDRPDGGWWVYTPRHYE